MYDGRTSGCDSIAPVSQKQPSSEELPSAETTESAGSGPVIEVLDPGLFSIIEDLGRTGLVDVGVGRSGAADLDSFRLVNRLVGNAESAATIEFIMGDVKFRFHRPATIALAGAPAEVSVGPRGGAFNTPMMARSGDVLRIGRPTIGLRSYLAIRGGIGVPPVLGSRSWDTLAEIGPPPLRRGDTLPVADDAAGYPNVDVAAVGPLPTQPSLRVLAGPRADWFDESALDQLFQRPYAVSSHSNRIGIRLEGALLSTAVKGELPPEGLVPGALQVPPSGQPVLFLADHPMTGGYPVIGVVATPDIPLAAQLRPGDTVRFSRYRNRRPHH